MIRLHVFVRGRVQGVGYRYWTAQRAETLGLSGFVRNRRDGAVEALLIGPAGDVAEMIEAMREGPPSANVTALEQADATAETLALQRPGERFAMLPTV